MRAMAWLIAATLAPALLTFGCDAGADGDLEEADAEPDGDPDEIDAGADGGGRRARW
jgi:hypothetical protein